MFNHGENIELSEYCQYPSNSLISIQQGNTICLAGYIAERVF